jgi:hypothetical protein
MAECLHCIHAVLPLFGGEIRCDSVEAHAILPSEKIEEFTAGGEHDCPFFEDDEMPW